MFYRTGTISLTNGSTAVTGAGTDFINGAAIGECIQAPDGKLYEILSIQSATALTLGQVYLGATASGQTYSIVPTQSYIRDLASQAATLVNDYATTNSNAFLITVADKATPVDTDRMAIKDVTTGLGKWVTLANVKSFLKTYFDSLVQTLTNKTINLSSNTLTGTKAQFNTAMSDADFATLAGTETLTNKTLTAPAINSPTGIVKGDVGLGNVDNTSDATKNAATATLTNKTINLTSNTLSGTLAQFNTAVSDGNFAMAGANTDITSLGALASVNGGQLAGLRNRVINGGMGVWQRGTSGTLFDSVLAYSADRMFAYVTGANVSFLQGGAVAQAGVASHLIVLGAAGSTGVAIGQRIENLNTADLDGKQITFSAWVYTPDSRAPIFLAKTPNGVNDYSAATPIAADTVYSPNTSGWRKIYFIVNSAPASIANGLSIEMQFGAAAAGINIACTALQLEVGSVATPFEHRPYGLELSLCQRYFNYLGAFNGKWQSSTTGFTCGVTLAPPMRVAPTATLVGSCSVHEYDVAFRAISAITGNGLGPFGGYVALTTASANSLASGNLNSFDATNGIRLSAEL